jgi:hypothetical protein
MNNGYFHIQHNVLIQDKWNIDDIIETSRVNNRFFNGIVNSIGETKNANRLLEHTRKTLKLTETEIINLSKSDPEILKQRIFELETLSTALYHAFSQTNKLMRENLFENIRVSEYSQRPSRKREVWLTDYHYLNNWHLGFEGDSRIYEVKILNETSMFETDAYLIQSGNLTISELEKMAHLYWKGDFDIPNPELKEILFEGKLKVINEYYSFDQIKNT